MDSEKTDIDKTRGGDGDAFGRLLSEYSPLISALVHRFYSASLTPADTGEDDLRQEASIALYLAALSYNPSRPVTFGLYAKICIKNRIISYLRRRCNEAAATEISEYIDDYYNNSAFLNSSFDEPLDLLISIEDLSSLKAKIKSLLTDYEYEVFLLHSDGITAHEAALRLGKSEKSISNAVQRIRKKLKSLFDNML